jgi:hypothetical protein
MATVRDRGTVTAMGRGRPGAALPLRHPITLSDLITAIQDVAGPGDDGLVVAAVRHLLRSRRLAVLGTGTRRCPPQPEETLWSHMVTGRVSHPSAVVRRWCCGRSPGERGSQAATGNGAARSPERR